MDAGLNLVTGGLSEADPVSLATSGLIRGERHAHERARIRYAVVELLAVHVLDRTRVHNSRPTNLAQKKLPAAFVYTLEESVERFSDAPLIYQRELDLAVHLVISSQEFEDLDGELDRLAWATETVLLVDRQLGGLAVDVELGDTGSGRENEGERVLAHMQVPFRVKYQTEHADLFGDDLEQIGVLYDFASPDGDIEAEDQIDL